MGRIMHHDIGGKKLTSTVVAAPAPVQGHPPLIERLVTNLIDNAVRHNVPTGRIEIRTGLKGDDTELSVSNTGPAIPAAEVDRLFHPFQRLSVVRARHDGDLGLGLSIVASIVTAHGATVTATPRPGGGLHVTVRFPAPAHDHTVTAGAAVAGRGQVDHIDDPGLRGDGARQLPQP